MGFTRRFQVNQIENMKLLSTLLFVDAASAASVTCMESDAADSPIKMTATVNNAEVNYDLNDDENWSCSEEAVYNEDKQENENVEVCRQSWTADQFDGEGEMTFDPENLILKKTITKDCENETVDGIKVCISKGHNMEFTCKYSLKAQLVDNTYDVTGHDTNIKEEGEGSLNYKLTVLDSENIKIGDTVQVDVEAVNEGLVFHTLQDCTVKKKFADADGTEETQQVSILNWHEIDNNLVTYCPNYLGASIVTKSSTSKATFSWKAFKWSTSQEEGSDAEDQLIECTIKLSQHDPMVKTPACGKGDYTKKGNHCFKAMGSDLVKGTEAQQKCADVGGFVPVPRSQEENKHLVDFANANGYNDRILLGIVDTETEGTYVNLRGNQAVAQKCEEGEECKSKPADGVWNNWSPDEPNDHADGEDFSELVVKKDDQNYGKRNDIDSDEDSEGENLVCQKPDYLCVDL